LVEAMAHGVPCVSSDCSSGPADIIRPGRTGWLFPVADTQALTGQLQELIAHRDLLPSSAAVRASAKGFSSERVFQRIRDAFEQTIQHYDRRRMA
jgi:UDP-D-galactose:(glucosyl)LPS alpha-1,6-D-galactosyltransferase